MEPAVRNKKYSGRPPTSLPVAAGRVGHGQAAAVAGPMFGTETVRWATDLSAKARALSTISCCGGDRRAVHCALQSLRGSRVSSGDLALRQPDSKAIDARENGEGVTRTLRRFATFRSFVSYPVERGIDCSRLLLADLPPLEFPTMVVADEAPRRGCHSRGLGIGRNLRHRPAILTVPCERVGADKTRPDGVRSRHCKRR
jgi:hypothetical protein